jgi:hypothetical protein
MSKTIKIVRENTVAHRNPIAAMLRGQGIFKAAVVTSKKGYKRRPKHREREGY